VGWENPRTRIVFTTRSSGQAKTLARLVKLLDSVATTRGGRIVDSGDPRASIIGRTCAARVVLSRGPKKRRPLRTAGRDMDKKKARAARFLRNRAEQGERRGGVIGFVVGTASPRWEGKRTPTSRRARSVEDHRAVGSPEGREAGGCREGARAGGRAGESGARLPEPPSCWASRGPLGPAGWGDVLEVNSQPVAEFRGGGPLPEVDRLPADFLPRPFLFHRSRGSPAALGAALGALRQVRSSEGSARAGFRAAVLGATARYFRQRDRRSRKASDSG